MPQNKPVHAKPSLYSWYFHELKEIAIEHGYNLVLHGSLNRDLDLIAIPWVDNPSPEEVMINALCGHIGAKLNKESKGVLPGGRHSYIIDLNRGGHKRNEMGLILDPIEFTPDPEYYIDISVTPLVKQQ